jgi:hypothetical protein
MGMRARGDLAEREHGAGGAEDEDAGGDGDKFKHGIF